MDGLEGIDNMDISEKLRLERIRAKARKNIGEVEELIPERLEKLKCLIAKECPNIQLHAEQKENDQFYLRCLRARKYDLQRAAKLYKRFLEFLVGISGDMIQHMVPSELTPLYKNNLCSVARSRDTFGRMVFIVRIEKWIAKETSFEEFLMCLFCLLDECITSIDAQLNGFVSIVDIKTLGLSHAMIIRTSKLQALISCLQDSYPLRIKEIHFLNTPRIFSMLYAIVKPLLKEKMRKRVQFHGNDLSSLHNSLSMDPSDLPEFLGGELSDDEFNDNNLIRNLVSRDAYFADYIKYGCSQK